jgi:CubicO group peptidase (beta-lactamase class C family)
LVAISSLSSGTVHAGTADAAEARLQARIRAADAWLGRFLEQEAVPGAAVALVHDQKVIWMKGFGHSDAARTRPATADTRFSICSISKLFTSMAAMQLRDEGRLELDAPIATYLPWYQATGDKDAPITIRALLSHVSGLPREAGAPYWATRVFPDRKQLLDRAGGLEATSPPFRYFDYSNYGMVLLGEIVASLSGSDYESYLQRRLLDPIGLKDTSVHWPKALYGREFAIGHGPRNGRGKRKPLPFYEINALVPAAGISSSAADLARFAAWQFRVLDGRENGVLAAASLRDMQRIHWVSHDRPDESWGLGFRVFRHGEETLVGHDGGCPGFNSSFIMRPQDRTAVIMLVNVNDVDPGKVALSLYDFLAGAVREAYPRPSPSIPVPPDLTVYEGVYARPDYHNHVYILPENGALTAMSLYGSAPGQEMEHYQHIEETTFRRVRPDGSLAETLRFELGRDGRPIRLWRNGQFMERR